MDAKKIMIGIGVALALGLIFLMYSSDGGNTIQSKTAYTTITADELNTMMKSKDFKLINVHIPYAGEIEGTDMFIPYNEIRDKIDLPQDDKIVLYCRSGSMSKIAAETLTELGYTNIYNLEKGMNGWKTSGFDLLNKNETGMTDMTMQKPAGLPKYPLQEYDPANAAYFAMGPSNLIKVVDSISGKIVDVLPAGNNPHGIVVDPEGEHVFTTSTKMGPGEMMMEPDHEGEPMNMEMMMKLGSNEISVTSSEERRVIKKIDVGGGTHHMAITPDGRYVLATVPSKSGIVLIDANTLEESSFVGTGNVPSYIAVSPDGTTAYVTNKGENTLGVVDLKTKKLLKKINVGLRPDHIASSPDGSRMYVADGGADQVSVVDTKTGEVTETIPVGESPHGVALSPEGDVLYVSNSASGTISVIATARSEVIKTIDVGVEISHVEVTPDGKILYANSEEEGRVYAISTVTNSVASEINIGAEPHQISFPRAN